ncbi:hypothetical protein ABPG72_008862 [Tetrahymena utriculariae]
MKNLIIIHLILNKIFLSLGQIDGAVQCDQMCQDCSVDKNFKCLGCKYPFYFDQNSQDCVLSCPSRTFQNQQMECVSCASKFCLSCSPTECFQCQPGYSVNPLDKQGCTANCQDGQYLLDGECVYECSYFSYSYSLDASSNTCIQLQNCPLLSYIPVSQSVGSIKFFSTSINEDKSALVQIDEYGKVIVKSIPQLIPQAYYTFPQLSFITNCVHLVEQLTQNKILSCINTYTQVFTFYISSGVLLPQNITLNQQITNVYYLDGMKMTFLTTTGQIVQYNFQSSQFTVVDKSSNQLNQLLSVQNYQQISDQFIITINSTNTVFYYDQQFNKNILLQYSSKYTFEMRNLNAQNLWVFYQQNQIDFYQIIFGQTPLLIKSITPTTVLYSIMISNQTLMLIGGQNQTAFQVFQISQNKEVTDITNTLPSTLFNSDCFWNSKDVYFSQKHDLLYIFNFTQNNFTISYTLKLSQPLVCSFTSLDVLQNRGKNYLLTKIKQDMQIQELSQNQLTSVNQGEIYFSSEQHSYDYNSQNLFTIPTINFLDAAANNQILELKGNGIAYQYDLQSRQIAKQFYIWDDFYYPDQILGANFQIYNFIVVQEEEKIILTGIRNGVLTIREINLYTFEILLENQFNNIDITPTQISRFKQPFYIKSTKILIIYIQNQYIVQLYTQQRQLHIFHYSQASNKYNYNYSIKQIVNDVQVSKTTGDIVCFLVLQVYLSQIVIYNVQKDQNPVFVSKTFYNACQQQLGFFNLNQDTIYYSDFYRGILSMNLLNKYQTKIFNNNTQTLSLYVSPTLSYLIFSLSPYNTIQIVSAVNNTILQVIPTGAYIPQYTRYDNKVFICSNTYTLSYYDGDTNTLILYQNQYYGQNIQAFQHKQKQVLFINTKVYLTISLEDPNLQLQQVATNAKSYSYQFYDIQIPLASNNNQLQQMIDAKQIFCYQYYNGDYLLRSQFVVNFYELDIQLNVYINAIKVIKYQQIIAVIEINLLQPQSLVTQNYKYYLLFDNKGYYDPYHNYMIIIVGQHITFIDSSSFEILFHYVSQLPLKNTAFDKELGYMAFIDNLQDCIISLQTISQNCIPNNYPYSEHYLQGTIIQRERQLIIFYSQFSLRVYSLKEKVYKYVLYSINFVPYSIHYNDFGSNIIIGEFKTKSFQILNLNTFQKQTTSFPPFITESFENNYKFYFFSDQIQVMLFSSYTNSLVIYDVNTQVSLKTILLQYQFNQQSQIAVDENLKLVLLIDNQNQIEIISYQTNQVVKIFQLDKMQNDPNAYQKILIWDSYKRKLFVSSNNIFYIYDYDNNIFICKYQFKLPIFDIYISFKKNQIHVTDYLNLRVFDYSILETNSNSVLPQNLIPNLLNINQNQYILFENNQSTLKNIVEGEVKDVKYFNQLNPSYFYFNFYNKDASQFYTIIFNQLLIYNITLTRITPIFSQLLDSQIVTFISDSESQVLFFTQKQSLYYLQKNQANPQLLILAYVPAGIGEFIVIDDTYLIYSSTKNSSLWNKITIQNSQSLTPQIKLDTFQFKLEQNDTVKQLVRIDNSKSIIMLTNIYIQIVDVQTGNVLSFSKLDFQGQQSQIYFDPLYQRILYTDRTIGLKVFDLKMHTIQQSLPSSGIQLKIEGSFLYMLSFNSVSIYLRQDLKLFQIIRNFNSTQSLLDIQYTGINNIFVLYFDNSIIFFNVNPFSQPKLIDYLQVRNYKLLSQQIQFKNSQYLKVEMVIKNVESTIKYTTELNIGAQSSNICSAQLQIQTSQNDQITKNQESDYLNLLSLKQLLIQKIIYSVNINSGEQTDLRYPFVNSNSVTSYYSLNIQPVSYNSIYLKTQNNTDQNIVELQLNNLKISFKNLNNTQYLLGNQTFNKLERLFLNNIELLDFGNNQLVFDGINHIFIQNLVIDSEQIELVDKQIMVFQYINTIIIQNIILINCQINNFQNLLKFTNINQLTISNFNISFNSFSSRFKQNSIISIQQVKLLTINNSTISQNIFQNVEIFQITNVTQVKINNMTQYKNEIIVNQSLDLKGIIFYFEATPQIYFNNIQFNILQFTALSSFSLLKFSNINQTLQFNEFYFANFKIINNQTGQIRDLQYFILECEGILNSNFSNVQILNSDMLGFISMHDLTNNKGIIIQNQISTFCNYQHLHSKTNHIMLLNVQQIIIQNSNFTSISNLNSDIGLIQIQVSQNLLLDSIQIQDINLMQNSFIDILESPQVVIQKVNSKNIETNSIASVFYLSSISELIMKNNNFISNLSYLDGGAIYLNQIIEIIFIDNTFEQNKSLTGNGGAIYCFSSIFTQFEGNVFLQNSCPQGSGGALLLNNCDIQDMSQNTFKQNSALIGGAFRYQGIQPQVLQKTNVSRRILTLNLNTFIKNSAALYGKNIGSYPIYLDVKNQIEDDKKISKAKLENVQSGSTSAPILMRFIDEEMKEVSFFKNTSQINQEILIEFGSYLLEVQSQEVGIDGNIRQDYNFNQFGFLFNVSHSYKPNANSTITVKTVSTIPILNTTTFKFDNQELSISIGVNFRKCQQGEILQTLQKYKICYTCQEGNYCLQDPNLYENLQCQKCPAGSKNCHSNIIQLQNGYWSKDQNSDQIYQCTNPENCIPEDPSNKNGCSTGHVGAICESCDSQGIVWGAKYGRSIQTQQYLSVVEIGGGDPVQHTVYNLDWPLLIIWFILIPAFFSMYLYSKRQKLQSLLYLKKFGLLYQEYKEKSYYWDLARNQARTSLVIFLNLIRTSPSLKASFLLFLMYIYLKCLIKVSPYQRQQLNNIDQLSCQLVIFSIFLIQMIVITDNLQFQKILQTFLIIINICFVGILLLLIIQRPVPFKINEQNILQRFQVFLSKLIPNSIYQLAYQKNTNLLRINYLWKKVKSSLREAIAMEADFKSQKWAQQSRICKQDSQFKVRNLKISQQLRVNFYKEALENCSLNKNQQ